MGNLDLYNAVRAVPSEAQKLIERGRIKGFTDINPMWRIKVLTEQFGPCGIGWKYETIGREFREGANGVCSVFVDIKLYVKVDGAWSDAIPGTGGSMFVAKETSGLYTSDECVKMATTDALSVACKALGVGADVYWDKDTTKYDTRPDAAPIITCQQCGGEIKAVKKGEQIIPPEEIAKSAKEKYGKVLCVKCMREAKKKAEGDPSETGF